MKVLIHAIGATMGGAMRHLTGFLPELGSADPAREYVVLARDSTPQMSLQANVHLERVPVAVAGGWLSRLYFDLQALPRRLRREQFAATVSLLNTGPIWSPVPHVLFQRNSLYFFRHPMMSRLGWPQRLENRLRRRLAVASMSRAAVIVSPSQAMAGMIQQACPGLCRQTFAVLYHGFDAATLGAPLDQRYMHLLQQAHGARLLYPTHPAPHKGFEFLFETLAVLRHRKVEVTLFTTIERADWPIGVEAYERQIAALGLGNLVVFLGRVPQAQMGTLYRHCDLMVYPSLCESFGFSMIEAMGHDLAIAAAATEVNQEICGNSALYFPTNDTEAAANRIEEALLPETRARLVGGGRARIAGFDWSWARYARDFVKIIDAVS